MTNTEATILAAVIGLVGGVIGVVGTYFGAVKLAQAKNKSLAGLRLREAFARELSLLQHHEGYGIAEIPHILKTAFEKHLTAVNEFRFFLTGDDLDSFNKAWREYDDYPNFDKYLVLPATETEDIQKVIDRIEAIRKFTKDN